MSEWGAAMAYASNRGLRTAGWLELGSACTSERRAALQHRRRGRAPALGAWILSVRPFEMRDPSRPKRAIRGIDQTWLLPARWRE